MTNMEQWRAVPTWEGYYEVSDQGRLRSVARTVFYSDGRTRSHSSSLLRPTIMKSGHLRASLRLGDRREPHLIHRLVLVAFVGPCPDGAEGCHWDGDPANNALSNLRWDTRSANLHDAVRHGSHAGAAKRSCKNGHPFDEGNTYRSPGAPDKRACKQCKSDRSRRAYQARKIEETKGPA